MYKLLVALFVCVGCTLLYAQQFDEQMAVQSLFQAKNALNRAAHAAAQQLDPASLAAGERRIDETAARAVMLHYLRENLYLDSALQPLPGGFWKSKPEVLVFDIINGDEVFPYVYVNQQFNFTETLEHPGVILVVGLDYPRTFHMIEPIRWEVKAAAELFSP